MSYYAVNIADLTIITNGPLQAHKLPVMMLLGDVITQEVVDAEPRRFDGAAAVLTGAEERLEAIVETLRRRLAKHQLRIYKSKTGKTWRRV